MGAGYNQWPVRSTYSPGVTIGMRQNVFELRKYRRLSEVKQRNDGGPVQLEFGDDSGGQS